MEHTQDEYQELELEKDSYYTTKNMPLAAALGLSHELVEIVQSASEWNKVEFKFLRSLSLMQLVENYKRKEMLVEPQAYYHALMDLRARMNQFTASKKY